MEKEDFTDILWQIAAIIAIILLILAFPSCKVQEVTGRNVTDSVRYIEKHIEVIDTVFVEVPREVHKVVTYDTISVIQSDVATSIATVSGGRLSHTLETGGSIPAAVVRTEDIKASEEKRTEKVTVTTNKLSTWQKLQLGGFWAILAAFIAAIVYLLIKRKKNA